MRSYAGRLQLSSACRRVAAADRPSRGIGGRPEALEHTRTLDLRRRRVMPCGQGYDGGRPPRVPGAGKMCRNIKTLFNFEPPATEQEIHASSLQFVRKLSGFNTPSKANQAAFAKA